MFTNIGGKIKKLTVILCIIGISASVFAGLILIAIGSSPYSQKGLVAIGFVVMIVGVLLSWIGSFFTYGFGELIENSAVTAELLAKADAERNNAQ